MGKYTPLREHLLKQGKDLVPMTFAEIEAVLNASLPASKRYPAWWSNNEFNNTMTSEWLAAGYQTESVDVPGEKLVFRKLHSVDATKESSAKNTGAALNAHSGSHPMFGCFAGLLTIQPGTDLTASSDEDWSNPYIGELDRERRA